MNYYSQAGQDKWIEEVLINGEGITEGTFVDIGCSGQLYSNTLGLEEIGWRGSLIDNSTEAKDWCLQNRRSPFHLLDASKMPWGTEFIDRDYLSLDVNGASLAALMAIPLVRVRFKAITIEHDAYRFGDSLRAPQREILQKAGYTLVRPDVSNPDPFEDWWLNFSLLKRQDYQ